MMNTPAQTTRVDLLRTDILAAFQRSLSAESIDAARRCSARLPGVLSHRALHDQRIFVAYGGGKDSSYMVAFVRLVQLLLFEQYGVTFRLIIATNRHAGMPLCVMENIDRVYTAIGVYTDPDVEVLLIDGDQVSSFQVDRPFSAEITARNRMDMLMTGHRCEGDARPTFCNACNLSMMHSFEVVLAYGEGVDVVITGDSSKEQRAYIAWVHQIAHRLKLPRQKRQQNACEFLQIMNEIAHYYFRDIYGAGQDLREKSMGAGQPPRTPIFFSIYQDTAYAVGEHWSFLTDFLGFEFDEMAFSFTESDCSNPAVMAHLRGLKAEHLYQCTYEMGVMEYVEFALDLMHHKDFPLHLIERMRARYSTPGAIQAMRTRLERHTREVLDLNEEQLVCMLYSPFVENGKNLARYMKREQQDLSGSIEAIHRLLAGSQEPESAAECWLAQRLGEISHLDPGHLRHMYRAKFSPRAGAAADDPISIILARDPHKKSIQTLHHPDGPAVAEVISGR